MAYSKSSGRRPFEYASKINHTQIISDPALSNLLAKCKLPGPVGDIDFKNYERCDHVRPSELRLRHVIAVDGGYTEIPVQAQFPSATIAFFQCGALSFSVNDLEELDAKPFIDPLDMSKLKNIERLKFALPVRSIRLRNDESFVSSVRRIIFDFYSQKVGNASLGDTLAWLLFEEFYGSSKEWSLASCPNCGARDVCLKRPDMRSNLTFACESCGDEIYVTDVLRLHEAVDEEQGAGGVLGYLLTTTEQILLVHFIKSLLETKPSILSEVIFIKDGPLAFFGQTANLHKPMRALVNHLFDSHDLFLVGLEKSGAFVEHAAAISPMLSKSQALLLNNDYIYRYVVPGKADSANPYGRTTYYGSKVIFKDARGGTHVLTLPTRSVLLAPKMGDFRNFHSILSVVGAMQCDMYDNALIPIALANKLVSLADHPSSKILERFTKSHMSAA